MAAATFENKYKNYLKMPLADYFPTSFNGSKHIFVTIV